MKGDEGGGRAEGLLSEKGCEDSNQKCQGPGINVGGLDQKWTSAIWPLSIYILTFPLFDKDGGYVFIDAFLSMSLVSLTYVQWCHAWVPNH